MSQFETIELEIEGAVATLRLNRPERMNSFNVEMHKELQAALDQVEDNGSVRALLLTGNGRGFCAGQDLADRSVSPGGEAVDLGETVDAYWNPLIRRISDMDIPVVCAVNGVAAGAGANLALACDIVIAAQSAKFIQSFAHVGLIPDSGGTWFLPKLIGHARAMAITLTATPVMSTQAEEWGMIWRAVDDDALAEEARNLVSSLASGATRGLVATKRRILQSWANSLDIELDRERDAMRELGFSADYQEGVAAFIQKRKPNFKGE